LQALAKESSVSSSPKVLVFPTRMGAPNPIPPPRSEEGRGFHPPTHGNWAQWGAIVVAIIIPFILKYYEHAASQNAEDFNLHVDARVDTKLNPAVEKINGHIDKRAEELSKKIEDLSERVGKLEGRFEQIDSRQKNLASQVEGQQGVLAKLENPQGSLIAVRDALQRAVRTRKVIPSTLLVDYKNTLRLIPPALSGGGYWVTVAAFINYQSLLNQINGTAPDPSKVSHPCFGTTGGIGNQFLGQISNCLVTLDTQAFENVTFSNSVILYKGGPVRLKNVTFENCRFILDFPPILPDGPQLNLVAALFDSPDQKTINVSTHS
jgi:hypothetical protein